MQGVQVCVLLHGLAKTSCASSAGVLTLQGSTHLLHAVVNQAGDDSAAHRAQGLVHQLECQSAGMRAAGRGRLPAVRCIRHLP